MGLKKEIKNTFLVSDLNSIELKNENGSHLDELASTTILFKDFSAIYRNPFATRTIFWDNFCTNCT